MIKDNYYLQTVLIATLIILSGCVKNFTCIHGNGDVIEETRNELTEFNLIESSGSFEVEIIIDTVYYVQIIAESNLINIIETKINNGKLQIDYVSNGCIENNLPVLIKVHTPEVNSLDLSGSGSIIAHNINTQNLDINLSGSGNIEITADTKEIYLEISGSGNIILDAESNYIEGEITGSGNIITNGSTDFSKWIIIGSGNIFSSKMQQVRSECQIDGSGNIMVWASDELNVLINGSGNVIYTGEPELNAIINGSGIVIKG